MLCAMNFRHLAVECFLVFYSMQMLLLLSSTSEINKLTVVEQNVEVSGKRPT